MGKMPIRRRHVPEKKPTLPHVNPDTTLGAPIFLVPGGDPAGWVRIDGSAA